MKTTTAIIAALIFVLGVGTASAQNGVDPNASPIMQGIQRMQNGQPIGDPCPYGCGHKLETYNAPIMDYAPSMDGPRALDDAADQIEQMNQQRSQMIGNGIADLGVSLGPLLQRLFSGSKNTSAPAAPPSPQLVAAPQVLIANTTDAASDATAECRRLGGDAARADKVLRDGILFTCIKAPSTALMASAPAPQSPASQIDCAMTDKDQVRWARENGFSWAKNCN